MEFSESTKIVYCRIQQIEPSNVAKIIRYLLLHKNVEREMIRLAFGPDNLILSLILKAKADLGLSQVSDLPSQLAPFLSASTLSYWDPQMINDHHQTLDCFGYSQLDSFKDDYHLQNSMHHLYEKNELGGARASRRSPSLPEFPVKICHYFSKGFCKNGSSCNYSHGHPIQENFSQTFSPSSNEMGSDDHVVLPTSLEKLETELTQLLKSRRGFPISIASLPMLYYEKYGRTLRAEGYLTESQRHGKAGYSLTKLLARLKNSIRLIDRPHGQHSVILAEDVPKFLEHSERCNPGGIVAGSRQIYLTFPAESSFSEEDVSHYFNNFGAVQDVRIPLQQKRMYGFVTFVYAETVKLVLAKGNPHFVCGARVLVKPYREKSRLVDRKNINKVQNPLYCSLQFVDEDSDFHHIPRVCNDSRLLQKHRVEEHEQALEFERRRLAEFQLAPKSSMAHHNPYFGFAVDNLQASEDPEDKAAGRFSYLLDVLSHEENVRPINMSYNDQVSSDHALNLPENPFASPTRNRI